MDDPEMDVPEMDVNNLPCARCGKRENNIIVL